MKFQYTAVTGLFDCRGKLVKRPVVRLDVANGEGQSISTFGIIDSGADTALLHIGFAKALGIKLKP
ncbi:hypothetical protein HY504_03115 [Candidatus Wolfebacteria bacterium]|nr:hypothetical protein [Candidatus Wolfebacteria bacterium]